MADEERNMDESGQRRTKRPSEQQRVPGTPPKQVGVQPVTKKAPGSGSKPGAGDQRGKDGPNRACRARVSRPIHHSNGCIASFPAGL